MQLGVPEESSLGDGFGAGHGMLGQAGSGKPKVAVEKLEIKHCVRRSGSTTSGFTSCLAFSSVLGMELMKTNLAMELKVLPFLTLLEVRVKG